MKYLLISVFLLILISPTSLKADDQICNVVGGTYVAWPTAEPIWEMCYLGPAQSSAAQGSSLEIRNVHLNGYLVLEKSHVPLLFANYDGSTCYRDWKNTPSGFIATERDQNDEVTNAAITTCDASKDPYDNNGVGNCPFGLSGSCTSGVEVEKFNDRLVLTTNHSAAWYKYSSRYVFFADGRFQPRFGFGNSTGNSFGINHHHLAYWRMNFDIAGDPNDVGTAAAQNDEVFIVDDQGQHGQDTEFSDFREILSGVANDPNTYTDEVTWLVKDSVSGRGFQMVPGFDGDSQDGFIDDYAVGTNPGQDGYHNVDIMVSNYKLINGSLPEYSDTPGSNSINNCSMDDGAIVNNESLVGVDGNPVIWYRTAVNDKANEGMLCKTGGPMFHPVGDWGFSEAPVAVLDNDAVVENSIENVIDVLANDTDADGGLKYIFSTTQPGNGFVTIGQSGVNVTYTPDMDYCNEDGELDMFEYTLNGGSSASVEVLVTCVDSFPVAVSDTVTVEENAESAVIDVLSNDTDVDDGPKFIESVTQSANADIVIDNGTQLLYTPSLNYCNDGSGADEFEYTLNGGNTANVEVNVTCVDTFPVAIADTTSVNKNDFDSMIDVIANDTDVDDGPLFIESVTQPNNGAVTISVDNLSLSYTPHIDYCNDGATTDDFEYELNGESNATVSVTVNCVGPDDIIYIDGFEN